MHHTGSSGAGSARTGKAARQVSAVILACLLAGAGPASEGIQSTDSAGFQPAQETYRRIIAFSPALTEIVYSLGAQDRLVGVSSFSDYPPEAKEKPRVGGILDMDNEKILSLRPDLVISPPGVIASDKLPRFGAKVAFVANKTLDDIAASFVEVGRLVGKGKEGQALCESLQSEIKRARLRNEKRKPVRTLVVIGYEPMWVAGGYGFINELLEAAGGINVAGGVQKDFYQVDIETVLAAAPQVIIDLTLESSASSEGREAVVSLWKKFGTIPAVSEGHIEFVDSDLLTIPGPRLAEGLAELEKVVRKAGGEESREEKSGTRAPGEANRAR